jgi:hypothetical protein
MNHLALVGYRYRDATAFGRKLPPCRGLIHELDVVQFPSAIKERLGRSVEAEVGEPCVADFRQAPSKDSKRGKDLNLAAAAHDEFLKFLQHLRLLFVRGAQP